MEEGRFFHAQKVFVVCVLSYRARFVIVSRTLHVGKT